jgi:hypothetical protein
MFLADGIRNLFGGGRSIWGESSSGDKAAIDRAQDDAQDAEDDAAEAKKQLASDDAALDDTQDQDDGEGWSDDGGTDV